MTLYPNHNNPLIAITAPAGNVPTGRVEQAVQFLEQQGFRVTVDESHLRQFGYLAGSDQERLRALLHFWEDPEVDLILAARGGYGCTRLLPGMPWEELAQRPKLLMGYSDLTALQNALLCRSGIASVSSPMAATELTDLPDETTWKSILPFLRHGFAPDSDQTLNLNSDQIMVAGQGEGLLVGGNLSVFTSLFGTPYLERPDNYVLLLEEQGEYPFRLDRYFRMLANAGWLENASGVILGHFLNCTEPDPDKSTFTAEELIAEYFGSLSCPIVRGIPYGHTAPRLSLPIGGLVRIETGKGVVEVGRG